MRLSTENRRQNPVRGRSGRPRQAQRCINIRTDRVPRGRSPDCQRCEEFLDNRAPICAAPIPSALSAWSTQIRLLWHRAFLQL